MKKARPLLKALLVFFMLIGVYLLLGVAAYMMPDSKVRQHVQWSIDKGDLGEDYPKAIIPLTCCQQDNFTDALILNQAIHLHSVGPKGILLVPRHDIKDSTQCNNLRSSLNITTEEENLIFYPRYWHGSTHITRIAMTFMAFPTLRFVIYIITSLMMLWCALALWRRVGKSVTLCVAFGLLMVNVYVMQFSVQFAPVLLIALAGMLWIAYSRREKLQDMTICFMVLGSLTACFDLLTVPTFALGLPLIVLVAARRDTNLGSAVWQTVKMAAVWALSYALTWAMKWVIATLFTGEDVFANAYNEADHWTSDGSSYIWDALTATTAHIHWMYILVPVILMVAAAIFHPRKKGWIMATPFLLVGLIPFAYLMVMAHHSFHHEWFTYRTLATSVVALLMTAATLVDWNLYSNKAKHLFSKHKKKA